MLATLQNGIFALPENPVMRGYYGMGSLPGGYAMGQPVSSVSPGPIGGPAAYGGAGSTPYVPYSVGPNGELQYNQNPGNLDGSMYTAQYCNSIIAGGNATSQDQFQCSIRGYVGVASGPGQQMIPPALVPDPPTSVTIPHAVAMAPVLKAQAASMPPPACGDDSGGIDMNTLLWGAAAFAAVYLLSRS